MESIPSSQFRKTYASLTEPTWVTVNGHIIGTWTPGPAPTADVRGAYVVVGSPAHEFLTKDRFNTKPFTPVPKKGK